MGGTGEDLPALLGLRSMRAKNAVLEMTPGKECLSFPGEGGYTINWSPGTMHCKLEQAPSGHLIMPSGEFGRLASQSGGLPHRTTTFHAIPSGGSSSTGSSGQDASAPAGRKGTDKLAAARAKGNRIGTGPSGNNDSSAI